MARAADVRRPLTETTGAHALDAGDPSEQEQAPAEKPSTVRAALAELVGTFILVFTGTATAVAASLAPPQDRPWDVLAVVLAFGLVLAALVAALSHVSGCHLNPAVTTGLAISGKFPWKSVPAYVIAQLLGAVLGALATWAAHGDAARSVARLASTVPSPGVGAGRAVLIEALVTFILVLVVVALSTDPRAYAPGAPIAIGAALAAGIFIAGPLTGGAVNPARALGPMLASGTFTSMWVYVVGPVLGAVVAGLLYDRVFTSVGPPK